MNGIQRQHMLRIGLLAVGWLLIAAAPIVGLLPGPGGVFVFAAGATLVLRNSLWAKKQYARFKRKRPKAGAWCDWSMRRRSARRRADLIKAAGRV